MTWKMNSPLAHDHPTDISTRAIVLGGSVAGLLAATALSEHFEQVVVIDRDELPTDPSDRRGVPQGRHVHGLLARGIAAINSLLPGFDDDLVTAGALRLDVQSDIHWYLDGHLVNPSRSGITGYAASRRLLEHVIRTRVHGLSNVVIRDACDVLELMTASGNSAVTGVVIKPKAGGAEPTEIRAHLVVDATGRASRTPHWLTQRGLTPPVETRISVGITYVTREYRREPHHLDGRAGTSVAVFPGSLRGAFLLAIEEDRFILTTGGIHGEQPPLDDEGLDAFARTLPTAEVTDFLTTAVRISEPVKTHYPTSVRRHYERLHDFPDGYLVIGDALCSFNPVYGQGISVAAMEAELLGQVLHGARGSLAKQFFIAAAEVIDNPWTIAANTDLRFDETTGPKPAGIAAFTAYLEQIYPAASTDAAVGTAFLRITNLLDRPEALLEPSLATRVAATLSVQDSATRSGTGATALWTRS